MTEKEKEVIRRFREALAEFDNWEGIEDQSSLFGNGEMIIGTLGPPTVGDLRILLEIVDKP